MTAFSTIRLPPYYRFLYNNKHLLSNKITINSNENMAEQIAKTTNWVAIITIIANAVVEVLKLIFS